MTQKAEFFIVGSVLSGTTLLRNILREHPNLICPEETHIFRWGDPFATETFSDIYKHATTLKLHRKLDGLNQESFDKVLNESVDRKTFIQNYFKEFKIVHKKPNARCFDKSPQNIYGLALIKSYFPKAKFVHIVRNPLNVIASIKKGHPALSNNILGSINYWKEAILLINTYKTMWHDDIYELKFENLCSQPEKEILGLLDFLSEDPFDLQCVIDTIYDAPNNYKEILSNNEIIRIYSELLKLMQEYDYE